MSEKPARRKEKITPVSASGAPAETVGGMLRHRRQMRGQSLEAVYQATRVPRGLLQALEEDRFEDLPAPVYLRSFLKTYCEYLELEFEPLWQKASPPPRTPEEAEQAETEAKQSSGTDSHEPPAWLNARIVLATAVALLALLVWGTAKLFSARKAPPAAETAAAPAPAAPAGVVEAAAPAVEPQPEFTGPVAPPVPAVDRNRLLVTAVADGWVNLRRDGQLVFEGRLPAGKHLDYRGAGFVLHTSDPNALRLELGGEPLLLSTLKPEPDGGYRFVPK